MENNLDSELLKDLSAKQSMELGTISNDLMKDDSNYT